MFLCKTCFYSFDVNQEHSPIEAYLNGVCNECKLKEMRELLNHKLKLIQEKILEEQFKRFCAYNINDYKH